ncbi:MAG: M56 family peptidase [Saprospirales bacterium]|nr:MAG: M56 family peptidase [Saprospirales bacterium]
MTLFYALQITLIVSLGLTIYHFGLRELRKYNTARFFLLLLMPAAVFLPLLYELFYYEIPPGVLVVTLDEVLIGGTTTAAEIDTGGQKLRANYWIAGIAAVYLVGLVFSGMSFLKSILRLHKLRMASVFEKEMEGAKIYTWAGDMPFSFMHSIFIPSCMREGDSDYKMVLRHEMSHVKNRHWLDRFWVNFQCVVFWFFPPVYWIRSAIDEVHELQADREVVSAFPKKEYMMLLVKSAVNYNTFRQPLASPFISLTLKKRIKMITGKNMVPAWSGFIMIICIAGIGALSLTGCKTLGIGDHSDETVDLDGDEEVFQIADEMPRFPGCEEKNISGNELQNCSAKKMLTFVYDNIKYPEIARSNGIEGTVVISFVVDRTGQIQNPKIVRDIGGECGKEALRVIELMADLEEKWIPGIKEGKAVNVRYNFPVRFSLEEEEEG